MGRARRVTCRMIERAMFWANGRCELMLLKNSKNPHSHFSAEIRCIG